MKSPAKRLLWAAPFTLAGWSFAKRGHVKAQFPGLLVPGAEVGAEVPVEELDAVLPRQALGGLGNVVVPLIDAGEKGRRKGGEAVLGCVAGGLLQPVGVAVAAAVVQVPRHRLHKGPQAVLLPDPDLHADAGGVAQKAVPPGLVLLPGVDVGVIPEGHGLDALAPQGLDAAQGTGGAAGVHENGLHGRRSFLRGIFPSIAQNAAVGKREIFRFFNGILTLRPRFVNAFLTREIV